MKNILKKKNIWLISIVIIFVVFIGYAVVQAEGQNPPTGPTDDQVKLDLIKPPIHRGGGQQAIGGFLDLISSHNGSMFDATSPSNKSAVFEKPYAFGDIGGGSDHSSDHSSDHGMGSGFDGPFFGSLGNSWVGGKLFVGVPRTNDHFGFDYNDNLYADATWKHAWVKNYNNGFGDDLFATLQKVNVQGDILATNLIHTGDYHNVCINTDGSLIICDVSETYHWETGMWSECSGVGSSTRTRTVVCKDSSNQTVNDSFCAGDKPATIEDCESSSYSCTGTTPANSGLCPEDDMDLTGNLAKLLVSSCGNLRKCEYGCLSGYHKSGSSCVEDVQVKIDWSGSQFNWVENTNYIVPAKPTCGMGYRVNISSSKWEERDAVYDGHSDMCTFRSTTSWSGTNNSIYQ